MLGPHASTRSRVASLYLLFSMYLASASPSFPRITCYLLNHFVLLSVRVTSVALVASVSLGCRKFCWLMSYVLLLFHGSAAPAVVAQQIQDQGAGRSGFLHHYLLFSLSALLAVFLLIPVLLVVALTTYGNLFFWRERKVICKHEDHGSRLTDASVRCWISAFVACHPRNFHRRTDVQVE